MKFVFLLVLCWFHIVPRGSSLFQVVSTGSSRWFQLVPARSSFQYVRSNSQRDQIVCEIAWNNWINLLLLFLPIHMRKLGSYLNLVLTYCRFDIADTLYLSVFSPNAGKYGPEITPYLDTFHAMLILENIFDMPKCTWPHPYESSEAYRCIYRNLTTCKK